MSDSSPSSCDLCGLSLRHGNITAKISGKEYAFCCTGCRQVFTILLEAADSNDSDSFRETELFKKCQENGIIPKSEADLVSKPSRADQTTSNGAIQLELENTNSGSTGNRNVLRLNLKIGNMWCPACAWLIDETLKQTDGIIDSSCNFSTDRLQVNYNPIQTSPPDIIKAVGKLGYRAAEPDQSKTVLENRQAFIRFAISAFLTMNIMMLSYALYTGFFTELSRDTIYKLSWPAFIMATCVLAYGGFELFQKAWAGIINSAFSMETLIIMSALSAYIYSTVNPVSYTHLRAHET